MGNNTLSDARKTQPSFDELVEIIKKLFTDYLEDVIKSKPSEIEKSWQRYKVLNHLHKSKDQPVILPGYQNLFDYLHHEHGLLPLQSEMSDIIDIVHKFHQAPGAVWVKGEYSRLYDQLKADPEKQVPCFVDYFWDRDKKKPPLRDVCSVRGETLEFIARGICYGGASSWLSEEDKKNDFLDDCERMNVQWLDESGTGIQGLKDKIQDYENTLNEIIKMSNAGKVLSHIDSHVAAKARQILKKHSNEEKTQP